MRLVDEVTDRPLDGVLLLLTRDEAARLIDSLQSLFEHPDWHLHVREAGFQRQITAVLYGEGYDHLLMPSLQDLVRGD